MRYTVPKEILSVIEGLEENKLSVISTDDYNSILYNTTLTEMTEDKVEIGLKLVTRSTYSNQALKFEGEIILDLDLVRPDIDGVRGYFHVLHTLDCYLRSKGKIAPRLMTRTHLTTLGVYYDVRDNKIYHVMNLIVLDDDIMDFTDMFTEHELEWEKIVDIISSPNLCKFDKMVLSKLRILK